MEKNLDRLQFVTRNYKQLQGLRGVPAGMATIALGLVTLSGKAASWPPGLFDRVLTLLIGFAVVGWLAAGRYYRHRFGNVTPTAAQRSWRVLFTLAMFAFVLPLSWAEQHQIIPFDCTFLAVGAAFVLLSFQHIVHWSHYTVLGLALMALSSLPALHLASARGMSRYDLVVIGIVATVCALLDHRILVKSLKPATPEDVHA